MLKTRALASALTRADLATAAVAMGLTEIFYQFHSFTLELAACALTWGVLRAAWGAVVGGRGVS